MQLSLYLDGLIFLYLPLSERQAIPYQQVTIRPVCLGLGGFLGKLGTLSTLTDGV